MKSLIVVGVLLLSAACSEERSPFVPTPLDPPEKIELVPVFLIAAAWPEQAEASADRGACPGAGARIPDSYSVARAMTYDDWKGRSDLDEHAMFCHGCATCGYPPERDDYDPHEVPEPDWDDIRESREEIRSDRKERGEE